MKKPLHSFPARIRTATCFLILVLSAALCPAASIETASDSGVKVWTEYPSSTRSVQWKGGRDAEGFASGYGVALFLSRNQLVGAYLGYMQGGRIAGDCIAIYPKTGMCYMGRLQNWSENGPGTMKFADGSLYKGNWSEGNRQGPGALWNPQGQLLYQGYFQNDSPATQSSLKRAEASYSPAPALIKKYQSSRLVWYGPVNRQGLASGYGVAVSQDQAGEFSGIFHGCAVDGIFNGDVVAIYVKVGQAYVGTIRDWSEWGTGTMFYPSGQLYTGEWVNANRQGFGTVYDRSGNILQQGQFQGDSFVSQRVQYTQPPLRPLEYKPEGNFTPDRETQINNALGAIAMVLLGQSVADSMLESDSDMFGALISIYLKGNVRSPVVDRNLKIIYPEMTDFEIHFVRNILCAVFDGTLTAENISERTLKTEMVAAAKREGQSEGEAMKTSIMLYDMVNKLAKIQAARNNSN